MSTIELNNEPSTPLRETIIQGIKRQTDAIKDIGLVVLPERFWEETSQCTVRKDDERFEYENNLLDERDDDIPDGYDTESTLVITLNFKYGL